MSTSTNGMNQVLITYAHIIVKDQSLVEVLESMSQLWNDYRSKQESGFGPFILIMFKERVPHDWARQIANAGGYPFIEPTGYRDVASEEQAQMLLDRLGPLLLQNP